ncbi:hypothetical protein HY642_07315 [Candidatus Woesearchaeota archaeon]|nr:hypothetical protein [Candidatus Woesearchaeota archaeon]
MADQAQAVQTAATGQIVIPKTAAPAAELKTYSNWHEAFDDIAVALEVKQPPGWIEGAAFAYSQNHIVLPAFHKDAVPLLCLALARTKLVESGWKLPQAQLSIQDAAFKRAAVTKDAWQSRTDAEKAALTESWQSKPAYTFTDYFAWMLVQEKFGIMPATICSLPVLQKSNTQLVQEFEQSLQRTGFAIDNLLFAIEWFAMLPWKFSAASIERNKLLSLWVRTAGLPVCSHLLPRAGVDKVARASAVFEQFGKKYFKSADWQKDPATLQKEFSTYVADIWANTGVDAGFE